MRQHQEPNEDHDYNTMIIKFQGSDETGAVKTLCHTSLKQRAHGLSGNMHKPDWDPAEWLAESI